MAEPPIGEDGAEAAETTDRIEAVFRQWRREAAGMAGERVARSVARAGGDRPGPGPVLPGLLGSAVRAMDPGARLPRKEDRRPIRTSRRLDTRPAGWSSRQARRHALPGRWNARSSPVSTGSSAPPGEASQRRWMSPTVFRRTDDAFRPRPREQACGHLLRRLGRRARIHDGEDAVAHRRGLFRLPPSPPAAGASARIPCSHWAASRPRTPGRRPP